MEKILSIHVGHDASAMYIDHKSILSIAEERVSRIKNFNGFPEHAINRIFDEKKINWSEIDKLVITSTSIKNSKNYQNFFFFKFKSIDYANTVPLIARLFFFIIRRKTFHKYIEKYLYKRNFNGKVIYLDHHLCHIASSLATYPINNSYLLSIDGGGDGKNWSFYSYKNQKLKLLEDSKTFYNNRSIEVHDTPADIYSNTTKFLGFKRLRDEGKVMGLSSTGKNIYSEFFRSLLKFKNSRFISKFGPQNKSFILKIKKLVNFLFFGQNYDQSQIKAMQKFFGNNYTREDISTSLQLWCENITDEFLNYLSTKYKFKNENLIVSGGFFSNILINQRIKERKDIKNISVTPNMGDGGLVLGGIYLASSTKYKNKFFSKVSKNVFYGTKPNFDNFNSNKFKIIKLDNRQLYKYICNSLIANKIIGIINGRMEFGPRALGNRSIIASPIKKRITEILNKRLKRSDFMPFAPFFRDKDAPKILQGYKKSDYSSKFMTVTYNVKENFKNKLNHIVHHDNTIRPQIIDKINNKLCYGILSEFIKQTNIPCLINTSFNIHEEPIVMDIQDGIKALENNVVDIIINQNSVILTK